ncbi:MAG: T9SS type A sorting domain-containing protein [Sphingobacteriales bacterium JAD_PAG50586_3]|nr:MAG: T9SS type A sorting domain-containing protein [Sphingobacteriales bacterium JAD_PAG50586_3]
MNKAKLLLLSILFLACAVINKSHAQSFIMPNATWCYYYSSFQYFNYTQFTYSADTTIDNYPTKIITENKRNYYFDDNMIVHLSGSSFFKKHYVRESNDTVWAYVDGQFYIQYIFNALPGDSWPTNDWVNNLPACNNAYITVVDTTSTTFNGEHLKGLLLNKSACSAGWPLPTGFEMVYYKLGPQTTTLLPTTWPAVDTSATYCASEDFVSYHDINNPMPNEGANYCKFNAVGVDENDAFSFNLLYPNPSTTIATFEYSLKHKANITFSLFDYIGKLVKSMYRGNQPLGFYRETIDVSDHPPGMYLLQIATGTTVLNKTLVIEN